MSWLLRPACHYSRSKSFRAPLAPELLSRCVAKEKVTKEKGHPAWRLPLIHGRQVREPGPGFSTGHPAPAKRRCHPWQRPLRGLSSPTHRRARDPGRAAGHPGSHSVRNRVAVTRAEDCRHQTSIRIEEMSTTGQEQTFPKGCFRDSKWSAETLLRKRGLSQLSGRGSFEWNAHGGSRLRRWPQSIDPEELPTVCCCRVRQR